MKAMIEYPGKTEAEIREMNEVFLGKVRKVGAAVFTAFSYVGRGMAPHLAALEHIEIKNTPRIDDDGEGQALAA